MADNIDVSPSEEATSVPVATDEIGGIHFPIYKISYGADGEQMPVTDSAPLPVKTTQANGVPDTFTKMTSNATTALIAKGSLNKISFSPRILNEHVESSSEAVGVVTSTNIIGQIFKASKDNISALMLTLESAAGVLIDDFEGYADSTEIQAAWIASTARLATLDAAIFRSGTQAMRLPTTNVNDSWSTTAAPQDFTGYTGEFSVYMSHAYSQQKIAVFIGDSLGNTKSFQVIQSGAQAWCDCEVNEAAMTDDQGTPTDITDIITIGYRVTDRQGSSYAVIDDLFSVPAPSLIRAKLWDMGATEPESGVTTISSGTQYSQIGEGEDSSFVIPLQGGKRIYHLERFFAGINKSNPNNETINIDNYYILELEYVDTDVTVYGNDTSISVDRYLNGFAFSTPNEAIAITSAGQYANIMFGIFSSQDVYVSSVSWRFNADPNGNSSILVFLEDSNLSITDVIVDHEGSPEKSFVFDSEFRPMLLADGGKLEFYYNDDFTDSVERITGQAIFLYEPPVVNG